MKHIKIGGHKIKITHEPDKDNDGYFSTDKNQINISPNITKTRAGVTLIHEALHAVNPTFDDHTNGHALLCSLAEQIYQVLEDNKLLSDKFYKICTVKSVTKTSKKKPNI